MTLLPRETDALAAHMSWVAKQMRRRAFSKSPFDGHETPANMRLLAKCLFDDSQTRTRLIFTRDKGHHTSGWSKNPDYERCLHLSTSPWSVEIVAQVTALEPAQLDVQVAEPDSPQVRRMWVEAFFGDWMRYVWAESPKSEHGRQLGVWHWRLFCDVAWEPLLPRGEVYGSELTERGWRSASQVLEEDGIRIESPLNP